MGRLAAVKLERFNSVDEMDDYYIKKDDAND